MEDINKQEWWAINMDEFSEVVFDHMEQAQDGNAGHTISFMGNRGQAKANMLQALSKLLEKMMYESDDYGRRK